ncbi:hypothetical protein PORY_002124 [Pneumocystis oryctolagi]|uniref:Uncharacterized protein n=1 Tax=Pneumocystis oryctolagi TaxID=42067 RepID=A0ACB7CH19_9ASCO|nr:hypothetical protein PORY_002124 [Pneumocystis oryctolagi]
MVFLLIRVRVLLSLVVFFIGFFPVSSLMFDIAAAPLNVQNQRCIRNFVPINTLVTIFINVSGSPGDGQKVNMTITDIHGNEYSRFKEVIGEKRVIFTTSEESTIMVCLNNVLLDESSDAVYFRSIELDINKGTDALNWEDIEVQQHLRPIEVELLKIEGISQEIANEMEYLQIREQKMRDINESTNDRVKFYGLGFMVCLIVFGVCEIMYLRRFFQHKHLI